MKALPNETHAGVAAYLGRSCELFFCEGDTERCFKDLTRLERRVKNPATQAQLKVRAGCEHRGSEAFLVEFSRTCLNWLIFWDRNAALSAGREPRDLLAELQTTPAGARQPYPNMVVTSADAGWATKPSCRMTFEARENTDGRPMLRFQFRTDRFPMHSTEVYALLRQDLKDRAVFEKTAVFLRHATTPNLEGAMRESVLRECAQALKSFTLELTLAGGLMRFVLRAYDVESLKPPVLAAASSALEAAHRELRGQWKQQRNADELERAGARAAPRP